MRGHGEIFSVKNLHNLYSSLVQPSMGMAIKAMIARYSCMSSSLCHWIWLVSILQIPILVRIYVSRVLFSVPTGYFCRPIIPYADNSQDWQICTFSIFDHKYFFLYSKYFNFVPPGSCIFNDMWRTKNLIFLLSRSKFCPSLPIIEPDSHIGRKWTRLLSRSWRSTKHVHRTAKYRRRMHDIVMCGLSEHTRAPTSGEDAPWPLAI